ncbi:flagellar assembly protein FliH [Aliamphritea hakodatensis]|uniref:flagellar assembly protein FliH n=1 Tax=Aliamphritea hakodatensis TaxID=2895352 RepID=UPI0022FDAB43|nr:flagellar assembly protein FliH [Aliamphritea hakodatensis]
MKAIDSSMVRIRAGEAVVTQPWDLPVVKSHHVVALNELQKEEEIAVVEDEIVAEKLTLSELESIRESARQEGYQEGLKSGNEIGRQEGQQAGYQEGMASGTNDVTQRISQLESMVQQVEQPLDQINGDVEHMLVAMVLELGRAVVGAELQTSADAVRQAVQDAVAQLPRETGAVDISVHPDQVELLEPLQQRHENWRLIADNTVSAGGCKVTTGNAQIDNTVDTRFQSVASQLQAHLTEVARQGPDQNNE